MTPERWQRIEEIFDEALGLAPTHREGFLAAVCGQDDELREEVESLLAHDSPDGERLASVVAEVADTLDPDKPGRRVGAYRIEGLLGHGGMGSVYSAVRDDDQFQKRVAIKIMRPAFDSRGLEVRFRHERQILARLDHPFIARLLDGGTTADGSPYLVMEFVDGQPLTQYCRDHGLNLRERLMLFRSICSAVQYAHRNLVVHRDLKPGNILVTAAGSPKLLDFGIAKLLDASGDPKATTTQMMTLDYASPEQVRGDPISTASDVYSLGVLLYELLAEARPYQISALSQRELEGAIEEAEPRRPSEMAVDRRAAELRGDLDNIVLKAMQKDPARRYGSVEMFSEDIQRHMQGKPVLARPAAFFYHAGKLIRRHALAVSAIAVIMVSLAVSILAATRQIDLAERRLDQLQALANTFLFDFHDKIQPLPGSSSARAMMVSTALVYLNSLAPDAVGREDLAWDIASAYERVGDIQGNPNGPNLGQAAAALDSYTKALDLKKRLAGNTSAPAQWRSLAACYFKTGDAQVLTGASRNGLVSFQAGLAAASRAGSNSADDMRLQGEGQLRIGQVTAMASELTGSVSAYRASVDYFAKWAAVAPGAESRSALARARMRLGYSLTAAGKLREALEEFRQSSSVQEEVLREHDIRGSKRGLMQALLAAGDILGSPYHLNLGYASEVEPHYRRALILAREIVESDPKDALARIGLATSLRRLGNTMQENNPPEALALYRQALQINAGLLATDAGNTELLRDRGFNLFEIGDCLRKVGDRSNALLNYQEALAIQSRAAATDLRRTQFLQDRVPTQIALGKLLLERGDRAAAEAALREAVLRAEALHKESPLNLYRVRDLSDCFEAMAALSRADSTHWRNKSLALWQQWQARQGVGPYDSVRLQRLLDSPHLKTSPGMRAPH